MKTLFFSPSFRIFAVRKVALSVALLSAAIVSRADHFYTNNAAGDFNVPSYWDPNGVPSDNTHHNNGSNNVILIQAGDPLWQHGDTLAGDVNGASGAYLQTGSTNNTGGGNWLRMGLNVGAYGSYVLSNGLANIGGRIQIAENGTGYLEISGGTMKANVNDTGANPGLVAGSGNFSPVANNFPVGTVVLNSGTLNIGNGEVWFGNGGNNVNSRGTGHLIMHGGTFNINNWFVFGRFGAAGDGYMDGGVINKNNNGNVQIGVGSMNSGGTGGQGYFTQLGGTFNCASEYQIGTDATITTATNIIGGNAILIANNWFAVGRNGANGVMIISNNAAITKNGVNGGNVTIGAGGGGNGAFSVGVVHQNGGTFTNTATQTYIGETGQGTWNLNSGTAVLGVVHLGQSSGATGNLNLNGGALSASEITRGNAGATTTITLNGGTVLPTADSTSFIHDLGVAQIDAGGAIIDTAGFNVTIPQALANLGGGGLTKNGAGILTLSGANTYVGVTTVNAGKLAINSTSTAGGDITVANGADLGVTVLTANAQVNAGNLTLATSTVATLDLDLGGFGNPTSAPLNVSSTFAVNGAITVNIADTLPQVGPIPLIKYNARTGSGTFSLGSLPIGVVASIVTNIPNSSIDLNITVVNTPRWDGQDPSGPGNWDIGKTTNWVNAGTGFATFYNNGNPVTFDDNALGTTAVNLVTNVSPASITANNNLLPYSLIGTGKISGATGFTMQGTNIFTIANTGGNNFTGRTMLVAGTLSMTNLANGGSPSAIGASSANPTNLVFGGGTLSYSGPPVTINRGYSATVTGGGGIATVTNLTLTGLANGGAGEYQKLGAGQLAFTANGSNALSGYLLSGSRYRVVAGTTLLDGSGGGQSNFVRNLSLGLTDGLDSTMIVSNTTLDVRNGFTVGDHNNATATLIMTNSTVYQRGNGNVIDIGDNNGNPASGVVIQNGGTLSSDGEMWVGQTANGLGTYTFSSGTINLHNWLAVGRAGGNGTFNMTGGTFNKDGNGSFIAAGTGAGNNSFFTVGTFNHSGGTINCSSPYWLSENIGTEGTNNISGTAVVNLTNIMSIGHGGHGVMNFSGGTIYKTGAGTFIIGDTGGNGYFNQTGGSLNIDGEIWIAQSATGTGQFDLNGGTVTNNNWLAVGREGGHGTLNIYSGTMTKTGGGNLTITHGAGATGTINQSGGTFSIASGESWIGEDSGPGDWNMNGGTAWVGTVHITQNSSATGTLSLNSGVFNATEITIGNAGGTSTLNLNGGTLVAANGASLNFLHDLTTANVLSGGAILDSGTNTINVSQALVDGGGGGGLTKNGAGTLRLNGVNTYTGSTLVSAGTLGGTGTIAGPVTIAGIASLAPGASIGTLTVNNNVTLGGTTVMEISRNGGVPTSDLLSVSGNLACAGALDVVLIGTNVLAVNDTFNLFDWGTLSGSFSATNLPAGYLWDTSQLYVDGTIRVTAVRPPIVNPPTISGGNFILTGVGGPAGASYTWLTSTNVAAPVATWTTQVTGVFDANGIASNAIPTSLNGPIRFFRLRTP